MRRSHRDIAEWLRCTRAVFILEEVAREVLGSEHMGGLPSFALGQRDALTQTQSICDVCGAHRSYLAPIVEQGEGVQNVCSRYLVVPRLKARRWASFLIGGQDLVQSVII